MNQRRLPTIVFGPTKVGYVGDWRTIDLIRGRQICAILIDSRSTLTWPGAEAPELRSR